MSTVIFLSNQDVKAVTGSADGRQVTVQKVYRAAAPEGSIVNGQVIDEEAFAAFLKEFWQAGHLPKKDVTLVLGSAQAITRVLTVPKMNHKKLLEYLPREFASAEQKKDAVCGYVVLQQEGAMVRLIASAVERGFLEPHIRRFKELGVRLTSVTTSMEADLLAIRSLSCIQGKTCVVQLLDGVRLVNLLYVDGVYYQTSTGRVFGEHGTPAFGVECARSISSLQQFMKAQQVEQAVTHVYLGGAFDGEDLDICRESIQQMDADLEVEALAAEQGGAVGFPAAAGGCGFARFVTPVGGLLVAPGRNNLRYQYTRDPAVLKRRREVAKYLAPTVVTAAVLGVMAIGMGAVWFRQTDRVNRQLDYLGNQKVIGEAAEYDRLTGEIAALDTRIGVVERTLQNLGTYPVYTSQVKEAVRECAEGVADADVAEFELVTGTVTVEAASGNAEGAHRFVERLEKRTDLFEDLYYDGFQYDEKDGLWRTTVRCYLAGPQEAAGTEVTS